MEFKSSVLGTVEFDENTVITFPAGLPAFESCTRFKFFHEDKENPRVFWMQSLDNPDVSFNVVPAEQFQLNYQIELSDEEVAALSLSSIDDAAILLMIYKEHEDEESEKLHPALKTNLRINMRNPLVLNLKERKGLQKVGLECDVVFHN